MLNFVYLRSFRLHYLHFRLDSCIVNKGGEFEHVLACCKHLEGFQVVSSKFWARWVPGAGRSSTLVWPVWLTGLTSVEQGWSRCSVLQRWFACIRSGGVAFVQGELACVQEEPFVVFELWIDGLCSLLEHGFVSDVSSRCPCLRGPRHVFFKWSCSLPFLWLRALVGVSF
jgi:hypothetical protein